jgi:uncharacterized protein with von Willebrand factor type A (vWA) domain
MFLQFFYLLRNHGLPVSLKEYLVFLEATAAGVHEYGVERFYSLAKTTLVKHEKYLDAFDKIFGHYFRGMERLPDDFFFSLPDDWLRKLWERQLTDEEKAAIEASGGWDSLIERFKRLLEEQKERHEGGNRWIGTAGTSPFGAYGYNPEGFRIGQDSGRHRRAVKVWDKREFKNLAGDVEINTRNIRMALRRLRILTREGRPQELDLPATIHHTSKNAGILDIRTAPPRKNNVKVLMLMDIGGSMDDHVQTCEELFSAAKHQFKHLQFYYFHNCVYESVWRDNRVSERIPTWELFHRYNKDWRVIFVGDAAMSPYELFVKGGASSHFNDEEGVVWLERFKRNYPSLVWLNPNPERIWPHFETTMAIRRLFDGQMYPLTPDGLAAAMKHLRKSGPATARLAR